MGEAKNIYFTCLNQRSQIYPGALYWNIDDGDERRFFRAALFGDGRWERDRSRRRFGADQERGARLRTYTSSRRLGLIGKGMRNRGEKTLADDVVRGFVGLESESGGRGEMSSGGDARQQRGRWRKRAF